MHNNNHFEFDRQDCTHPQTKPTPIYESGNRNDYIFFQNRSRDRRAAPAQAASKFEFEIGTEWRPWRPSLKIDQMILYNFVLFNA